MVVYFPGTYPDELLYSVLARYSRHTASISPKKTLAELFGNRMSAATTYLPGYLASLAENLPPDRCLTSDRLALEFTLFPYYTAFVGTECRDEALRMMASESTNTIFCAIGMAASTVRLSKHLRYCKACFDNDMYQFSEAYWHRSHQLPGVLFCVEHDMPLYDSEVAPHLCNRQHFVAATADNCLTDQMVSSRETTMEQNTLLKEISKRSVALLKAAPSVVSPVSYREALAARGLVPGARHVDQVALFRAYYTIFHSVHALLPVAEVSKWLPYLLRKRRSRFHPLYHVLFGMLLDELPHVARQEPFGRGPWTCLNPMAEHQGQQVVTDLVVRRINDPERGVVMSGRFSCSCGYVYRRNSDVDAKTYVCNLGPTFESRLRAAVAEGYGLRETARILGAETSTVSRYTTRIGLKTPWEGQRRRKIRLDPQAAIRDRWINLQQEEPEISRRELSRRLTKEYHWLLRYDRVWLQDHSPKVMKKSGRQIIDWRAVDLDLVSPLSKAAEMVRKEIPPCRITAAELERRLGKSNWISPRRKKLPETMTALASLKESSSDFRKRRIAWALVKFGDTGAAANWKIVKLAGITNMTKKEVEAVLADLA